MTIKYLYWNDDTGYGISARQMIKVLQRSSIKVIPVGLKRNKKKKSEYEIAENIDENKFYDIVFMHLTPHYVQRFIEHNKINIAFSAWETTKLPRQWATIFNQCDAVFVPSQFIKMSFEKSNVTIPVFTLPYISEFAGGTSIFNKRIIPQKPYTFYSIGMWTNRKNYVSLISSFKLAFKQNENVKLIIKTSKKDYTKHAYPLLKKIGLNYFKPLLKSRTLVSILLNEKRIQIIPEDFNAVQISTFHTEGDCFVSLCKSEGWGLGAYDAVWFAKPVIITNFGGQLDFLPEHLATLLPFKLVPIEDSVWTEYNTEGQEWAEVDIQDAARAMLDIYHHQTEYVNKGKELRKYVSHHFNEKRILESFIKNLEYIVSKS